VSSFDTFVAERSALSLSWFFMDPPNSARTYIREPLRTLSLGCNTQVQCIRASFCESPMRRFRAGTTPFSPPSARR